MMAVLQALLALTTDDISGEWRDVGPNGVGALATIRLAPASKNFTTVCNGPACGAANGKVWGTGPVSPDGKTYDGFSIPGAISADNNTITWTQNGQLVNRFERWYPAMNATSNIAGSFVVFVYGAVATDSSIAGQAWAMAGDNSAFTVTAPGQVWSGQVECSITDGTSFVCPAWIKMGVTGKISADFNTVNFSNGVFLKRIDPASVNLASKNLNGATYGVANMPQLGRSISPLSRSKRYVDVYTPLISSLYSQVQWSTHNVPLPTDFVQEFDGRVVNIVGYEFDIIRPKDPTAPCVSSTSDKPLPCERTSVPNFEQYNHHYSNQLFGKGTSLVKTGIPSAIGAMAGHTGKVAGYEIVTDEDEAPANPRAKSELLMMFGNGAESKHTIKYMPKGFGCLLGSPTYNSITPMIIDTNARGNHSSVPSTPQVPGRHGPVPKSSNVGPEAMYSGIMECPCTDAFPKIIASATTLGSGVCVGTTLMGSAEKCFDATYSLGLHAKTNGTIHTDAAPAGCSATAISGGFEVSFNTNIKSQHQCGSPSSVPRRVAMAEAGACDECALDIDLQPTPMAKTADISGEWRDVRQKGTLATISWDPVSKNFTTVCVGLNCGAFNGKVWGTGPVSPDGKTYDGFSIPGAISADNNAITWTQNGQLVNRFERWYPAMNATSNIAGSFMRTDIDRTIAVQNWDVHGSNDAFDVTGILVPAQDITGCSIVNGFTLTCPAWTKVGVTGKISADFNTVKFSNGVFLKRIDPASLSAGNVTITMSGTSDAWFGAGFLDKLPVFTPGSHSGSAMEGTWAVVALGDGTVQERKLGNHLPGMELTSSITVTSNVVKDGVRTVVLTRALAGATADHYTFNTDAQSIAVINAVGSSAAFGYHKKHSSSKLYYVDAGEWAPNANICPDLYSFSII
jgi:hypothetical protein